MVRSVDARPSSAQTSSAQPSSDKGSLGLLAHEYFHLFNAKRLRPAELGPFDFEKPPATGSLWIAEGLFRRLRAGRDHG